jgi:hypothetical protein
MNMGKYIISSMLLIMSLLVSSCSDASQEQTIISGFERMRENAREIWQSDNKYHLEYELIESAIEMNNIELDNDVMEDLTPNYISGSSGILFVYSERDMSVYEYEYKNGKIKLMYTYDNISDPRVFDLDACENEAMLVGDKFIHVFKNGEHYRYSNLYKVANGTIGENGIYFINGPNSIARDDGYLVNVFDRELCYQCSVGSKKVIEYYPNDRLYP